MCLVSRWDYVFSFLFSLLGSSGGYGRLVSFILLIFLLTRVPYVYGLGGFGLFLFFWVLPLFLSFFFSRLSEGGLSEFFSSLVPHGTPLWISPLVVLAETVSYIVRPFVLLLRPFLNISIGSFGGVALGLFFLESSSVLLFLFILFFYEVFVALVHWFIVCNILSFSKDH